MDASSTFCKLFKSETELTVDYQIKGHKIDIVENAGRIYLIQTSSHYVSNHFPGQFIVFNPSSKKVEKIQMIEVQWSPKTFINHIFVRDSLIYGIVKHAFPHGWNI